MQCKEHKAIPRGKKLHTAQRFPHWGNKQELPKFQPPSYYARAAEINRSSPNSTPTLAAGNRDDGDSEFTNQFMPISYVTGTHQSDSSIDERTEGRFGSLCRKMPGSSIRCQSNSPRRGHIGGLPQLEREILPSLKDTIDRMTRIPPNTMSPSPRLSEYQAGGNYKDVSASSPTSRPIKPARVKLPSAIRSPTVRSPARRPASPLFEAPQSQQQRRDVGNKSVTSPIEVRPIR